MKSKTRRIPSVKSVVVLIGLFFLIMCSLEVRAETTQQPGKEPAKAAQDKGPASSIQFAELSHDFGKAAQNAALKYAFTFKNTGKGKLLIENVKAS